jgi:hypothetical protein
MQAFNNIGVLAAWTGLIFFAWLLVRERGMKDKQVCKECVAVSSTLLVIWFIGSLVFLWTPSGLDSGFFLEGFNFLLFAPMILIIIDTLWMAHQLRERSD